MHCGTVQTIDGGEVRHPMSKQRGERLTFAVPPRMLGFAAALLVAFAVLGTPAAFGLARVTVLARAQAWIDYPVPYSQSRYFTAWAGDGRYRTDCSGFASFAWKTRIKGRACSWTTSTMHHVAYKIPAAALLPGDAMLRKGHHVRLFYGWVDATHTSYVAYEQTGPWARSSIKDLARDLADGYVPTRYKYTTSGPPPWNAIANPTFDVWAAGMPVWWGISGVATDVSTRTVGVSKTGKWGLGLLNPSTSVDDVVETSQSVPVIPGKPYTVSLWARTSGAPSGLEMRLCFYDASGTELAAMSTTGAFSNVGAASLSPMSITTVAPAGVASASVRVRLAGGMDAAGAAGVAAVIDDVSLYDPTPASAVASISKTKVARRSRVTLRGRVAAPIPAGTVRIYVIRPGKTKPIRLADKTLVNGSWSMKVKVTLRGSYRFIATYLGYGPQAPVSAPTLALRVK